MVIEAEIFKGCDGAHKPDVFQNAERIRSVAFGCSHTCLVIWIGVETSELRCFARKFWGLRSVLLAKIGGACLDLQGKHR